MHFKTNEASVLLLSIETVWELRTLKILVRVVGTAIVEHLRAEDDHTTVDHPQTLICDQTNNDDA
jgi:hypothetical protein